MTPRFCRVAVAAILCLPVAARTSDAQQIRGLVRDSASGAPVAGAVVSSFDDRGNIIARTIADGSGRFRIARPVATTRLEVLRIGFRPHKMAMPQAAAGQEVSDIVVELSPVPTLLETVSVEDRSLCPPRADHDQALALWEQADAALLTAVVARQAYPARVDMLVYDREMDRGGHIVASQRVRQRSGSSTRPFTPARPPADFAQFGYVTDQRPRGSEEFIRTYDAPDADVLLDESFATTHCFQIARSDAAHVGELGLAFEPATGRDTIADVAGTLWVRPSPAAIEWMDFRYTGLEPAVTQAGAGGSMSFQTMSNGAVFIDKWSLRMPLLMPAIGVHRDPSAPVAVPRQLNRDSRVSQIIERGGVIASAVWPDGAHWIAPLGGVRGRVVSADAGTPISNAVVWLEGGESRATTDADGSFTFDRLLAGPYSLQVSDSILAAFGSVRSATQHVVVTDSATADTKIMLPRRDRAVERVCGKNLNADRGALVLKLEETRPPELPAYVVQWSDAVGGAFRAGHVNSAGVAAVCDVPIRQPVGVTVRISGAATDTTVLLPPDRVAVVTTSRSIGRASVGPSNGQSTLVFRVADTSTARSLPLGGVEVAVPDGGVSARTNLNGVAVLRALTPGSHDVIVRGLGRAPLIGVVELLQHDSLDVPLRMTRTERLATGQSATQLPAVQVDAERQKLTDRLSGFEERRVKNLGYFLTEDSIVTREALRTTELFERIPGVRVSDSPSHVGERIHVYSSHDPLLIIGGLGGNDPRAGKPCELALWLNGTPMDTTFDINSIPPSAIHGIEVYHTSNTPAQFSALTTFTNACGSLVIWTK